jgi:hypothetical protein
MGNDKYLTYSEKHMKFVYIQYVGKTQTLLNDKIDGASFSKGCHLDVVGGPSTRHDPESDTGGSSSSWQGHPSR